MLTLLFGVVILLACAFTFLNGFRDAANSIAGAVRTGALRPKIAVISAALFSALGTLLTSSFSLALLDFANFNYHSPAEGLGTLAAALIAAGVWLVWCWSRGIPHSSTHALFAALAGALLGSAMIHPHDALGVPLILLGGVLIPIVLTPALAFGASFLLTIPATWLVRHSTSARVTTMSRAGQSIMSMAVALGNGLQDGQRNAAVMTLAAVMYTSGTAAEATIPFWAPLAAAMCMGLGALGGGWRIAHTIGYRMVRFDPLRGAVAQGVSATMLFAGSLVLHLPLSTTQAVTSAVVGAGANQRFESVHWGRIGRLLGYWVVGPALCAVGGWVLYLALHPLTG
ncbi:inorganic phosphate transporter [Zhihengliuella flava]|uniref:PiT family inorganic phosphate transporter n=1 Tax=Zhihengliuella flava TaxID=1285193 RepID=A0A931DA82_9MICC|nr:inorganic phosphate transporter [Zhihengliuella flava]MBG6084853.1 PiT family inorganic phosphate transporter [Zhihengliuella flava]